MISLNFSTIPGALWVSRFVARRFALLSLLPRHSGGVEGMSAIIVPSIRIRNPRSGTAPIDSICQQWPGWISMSVGTRFSEHDVFLLLSDSLGCELFVYPKTDEQIKQNIFNNKVKYFQSLSFSAVPVLSRLTTSSHDSPPQKKKKKDCAKRYGKGIWEMFT